MEEVREADLQGTLGLHPGFVGGRAVPSVFLYRGIEPPYEPDEIYLLPGKILGDMVPRHRGP